MMGNYMNAGSRNQQSFGFDLNYLTKLSSTKSADQKTTLLHFLANTIDSRFPDIKDFAAELRNVEEASKGMMCVCASKKGGMVVKLKVGFLLTEYAGTN